MKKDIFYVYKDIIPLRAICWVFVPEAMQLGEEKPVNGQYLRELIIKFAVFSYSWLYIDLKMYSG